MQATAAVLYEVEQPLAVEEVEVLIDLFMAGKLRIAELVSRRLPLAEINHAFDLMQQGEVKRSVLVYE